MISRRITLLQNFCSMPLITTQLRVFSAQVVPEPKTVTELLTTGYENLALTKKSGLDYERVTKAREYGKTNKMDSFKSFEEEINA